MPKQPPVPKKTRPCRNCGGTGYVTKWTKDRDGKRISYEAECDVCQGTGETTAT
jgi:DnaJ-class molecular chaperone